MAAKRVDPKEAKALMDQGWTYVDVRTEQEFDAGHPAGSLNIPMNSPDFPAVMARKFSKDSKLIIGCLMGGRSARVCGYLESEGYTQLADQTAGWGGQRDALGRTVFTGWLEAKLPTGGGTRFADVLKNL